MEKNKGKAIYLNLNLKNYRKALQTTYKACLLKISRFFSTIQAGELSFVNKRFTEIHEINNFAVF